MWLLLALYLQSTMPLTGVGTTVAAAGSNCLLIEGTADKITLEDASGCIALE